MMSWRGCNRRWARRGSLSLAKNLGIDRSGSCAGEDWEREAIILLREPRCFEENRTAQPLTKSTCREEYGRSVERSPWGSEEAVKAPYSGVFVNPGYRRVHRLMNSPPGSMNAGQYPTR